jgi:CRP/FNR family transcriptional regulator, cyclic AMP receptor protein
MQTMAPGEIMEKLAGFPILMFERGDVVLAQGSATGRLLFLKQGTVDIVMEEVFLTRVMEPGAVFGDVALLLDQGHTADVLAVQSASFYVVEDAETFLRSEPLAALYVATVLAGRLNAVNHLLVEARNRAAEAGARRGFVMDLVERMGRALQIRVPPSA